MKYYIKYTVLYVIDSADNALEAVEVADVLLSDACADEILSCEILSADPTPASTSTEASE